MIYLLKYGIFLIFSVLVVCTAYNVCDDKPDLKYDIYDEFVKAEATSDSEVLENIRKYARNVYKWRGFIRRNKFIAAGYLRLASDAGPMKEKKVTYVGKEMPGYGALAFADERNNFEIVFVAGPSTYGQKTLLVGKIPTMSANDFPFVLNCVVCDPNFNEFDDINTCSMNKDFIELVSKKFEKSKIYDSRVLKKIEETAENGNEWRQFAQSNLPSEMDANLLDKRELSETFANWYGKNTKAFDLRVLYKGLQMVVIPGPSSLNELWEPTIPRDSIVSRRSDDRDSSEVKGLAIMLSPPVLPKSSVVAVPSESKICNTISPSFLLGTISSIEDGHKFTLVCVTMDPRFNRFRASILSVPNH